MRKINFFSALLSLFLLVPASITWAQSASITGIVYQNNTVKIPFTVPVGKISVYMPDDAGAGGRINGTVFMESTGKNEKQKEKNLELLKQYIVTIGDAVLDADILKLNPSADPGKVSGNFNLPDNWWGIVHNVAPVSLSLMKEPVASVQIPLLNINPTPGMFKPVSGLKTEQEVVDYRPLKRVITSGENLVISDIRVPFDMSETQTYSWNINDHKVIPLCSSPRQTVITVPPGTIGKTLIEAKDKTGKTIFSDEIYVVDIRASIEKANLHKGERTNMQTAAGGIRDCPYPVTMTIVNRDQETVLLDNGVHQTYSYDPAEGIGNPAYSPFNIRQGVTGVVPGAYNITANLILPSYAFGDVFHQQKSALKTPEDYNAWADAVKKDLKAYADKQGNDEVGKQAKANAERAIDNIPKCYDKNKLDECKAFADAYLRPVNVPKGAATMWLSGFEAYKAAIKAITGTLGGKAELIDWEVIKNGLEFIRNMGEQLKDERLQNGASDAKKIVEGIQKAGETKEKLQELNDKLNELNGKVKKEISTNPSEPNAYQIKDLQIATFINDIPGFRTISGTNAILNINGQTAGGVLSLKKSLNGMYEMKIIPGTSSELSDWFNSFLNNNPGPAKVDIIVPPKSGTGNKTLDLKDVFIHEIEFPKMDLEGNGKGVCIEKIIIHIERFEYEPGGNKSITTGEKQEKKWMTANFNIKIDGLPDKNIRKVDLPKITAKVATEHSGGFNIPQNENVRSQIPDIKFQVSEQDIKEWKDWYNNFEKNKETKTGSINYLNEKGESLFSLPLRNIKPVQIAPAENNLYNVTIASLIPAKGDVSGNDAVVVPAMRYAGPDPVNDMVAFYDPFKSVMHIVPDYLQQALDYFRAIQITPGKYSMQSITADRAPVNCIFTVIPSNPLEMYLESQAVTVKILCQQQTTPVGKPVLIDTITDIKTGTSLIVYKNAKCGEEKRGSISSCRAEMRGAWDFSVKPPKSIAIETGRYSKREYLPTRKCEAGNEFCVEALVVHLIEYWYMDKECKRMIDIRKFKDYFCW